MRLFYNCMIVYTIKFTSRWFTSVVLLTSLTIINLHELKARQSYIDFLNMFCTTEGKKSLSLFSVILACISTLVNNCYFVCCFQGGLILLVLVLLFKIAHKNVSRTLAVEVGGETIIQVVLPMRL